MRYHLSSATQRAKDVAFSGTHPSNEPETLILVPKAPPRTFDDINTSTPHAPGVPNPSSHHQRHEPMSFLGLLLLTFVLAVLLVLAIYLVFHTLVRGYTPSFEDFAPQYAKKLRKRRPPPLDLVTVGADVEAQSWQLIALGGGGAVQAGSVRRRSPGGLGERCGGLWGKDDGGGMATGTDADGDGLTPFSPARARARKYGEGDVEAKGVDGEDGLGLERYFFEDGVGIMRYESTAKARGWKEG